MTDEHAVRWFGENWGAPINTDCAETPTPVGTLCLQCDEPIEADDRGVTMMGYGFEDQAGHILPGPRVAVHIDCHMRSIRNTVFAPSRKP